MDYIQHIRSMVGKEKVIMVVAGAFVFDHENRCLCKSVLIMANGDFQVDLWS